MGAPVGTSETSSVENTEPALGVSAGATDTAFSDAQYDESYPEGYENHFWNLARTNIVLNALQRNVAKTDVILEIGCGRGLYVSKARQAGFVALGCDLGRPRVHDAVSNYVQVGTDFRELDPTTLAKISVVLLLDVLEHLEHPDDFLKQLSATMPVHTVIATVPARKELWSNYDDHFGHFRRYTKLELETLMRSAGFKQVEGRYRSGSDTNGRNTTNFAPITKRNSCGGRRSSGRKTGAAKACWMSDAAPAAIRSGR